MQYNELKDERKDIGDMQDRSRTFMAEANMESNTKVMTFDKSDYGTDPRYGIVSADVEKQLLDANTEDLKGQINLLMEKVTDGDNRWKCKECGKTSKDKTGMSRHIETHMEGISYPCNQCGAVKRSSNALNVHITRDHRN